MKTKLVIMVCLLVVQGAFAQSNVLTEVSSVDVSTPFAAGFGAGLTMFGFGWMLRLPKAGVQTACHEPRDY
jgi:hypothetical protein